MKKGGAPKKHSSQTKSGGQHIPAVPGTKRASRDANKAMRTAAGKRGKK
jgi:hypothetical protein